MHQRPCWLEVGCSLARIVRNVRLEAEPGSADYHGMLVETLLRWLAAFVRSCCISQTGSGNRPVDL